MMILRRSTAILIGGGVGPAAGVQLHSKLVSRTEATGDADHFTVFHVSVRIFLLNRISHSHLFWKVILNIYVYTYIYPLYPHLLT